MKNIQSKLSQRCVRVCACVPACVRACVRVIVRGVYECAPVCMHIKNYIYTNDYAGYIIRQLLVYCAQLTFHLAFSHLDTRR